MRDDGLSAYLDCPITRPAPDVSAAIAAGPIDPGDALALDEVDRLLDPAPLRVETGWCSPADRVGHVAARQARAVRRLQRILHLEGRDPRPHADAGMRMGPPQP